MRDSQTYQKTKNHSSISENAESLHECGSGADNLHTAALMTNLFWALDVCDNWLVNHQVSF